jgi:hypothetical protein
MQELRFCIEDGGHRVLPATTSHSRSESRTILNDR